jgi:hypothetical protein
VVLSKWSLHADYFDGDLLSGPVPLLFAENPDEALANMLANKEKVNKKIFFYQIPINYLKFDKKDAYKDIPAQVKDYGLHGFDWLENFFRGNTSN